MEENKIENKIEPKDANGRLILKGSVLKRIDSNEDIDRGVVTSIKQPGEAMSIFYAPGDLIICHTKGYGHKVSSMYDQWVHIPKKEQTLSEKLLSWFCTPCDYKQTCDIMNYNSPDEAMAIDAIMNLCSNGHDTIDPFYEGVDSLEDALNVLVRDLEKNYKRKR